MKNLSKIIIAVVVATILITALFIGYLFWNRQQVKAYAQGYSNIAKEYSELISNGKCKDIKTFQEYSLETLLGSSDTTKFADFISDNLSLFEKVTDCYSEHLKISEKFINLSELKLRNINCRLVLDPFKCDYIVNTTSRFHQFNRDVTLEQMSFIRNQSDTLKCFDGIYKAHVGDQNILTQEEQVQRDECWKISETSLPISENGTGQSINEFIEVNKKLKEYVSFYSEDN